MRDSRTLRLAVAQKKPGTKVALDVRARRQAPERSTSRWASCPREEQETAQQRGGEERNALQGAQLDDVSPDLAEQLDLPRGLKGAVVTQIQPGSRPWRAGLRTGDVIVEVEAPKVDSAAQALAALRKARGDALLLRVFIARQLPLTCSCPKRRAEEGGARRGFQVHCGRPCALG